MLHLTSTGRLARRLRHNFRLECIERGMRGWYPPRIMSLNTWLQNVWADLWPETVPSSELFRTCLWNRLTREIPPPSPFQTDLDLCRLLDENYGAMIRHGLNPADGIPSTPLVEWRREISGAFRTSLGRDGFFHPSELPLHIYRAIEDGKVRCPESILLSGFESPAPIETGLFSLLESKTSVEYSQTDRKNPARLESVALPSPEQERDYLIQCLAEDGRKIPLHGIGVIAPDLQNWADRLEEGLKDVLGNNPPHGSQWFNITLGKSLYDSSLVQAALLPLRFLTEREDRDIFLSLLLSPYYRCWQGDRQAIARADRVWRKYSIESGLDHMISSLKKHFDITEKILAGDAGNILSFREIRHEKSREIAFWIGKMTSLWSDLGFPVISDERDNVAWRHLKDILNDMMVSLSKLRLTAGEFLSWIIHVVSRQKLQTNAFEEAGIQIMGVIEARGLDFDKIYILDMNERSLPQPVRPLPLLDRLERRAVQGGTIKSQYNFAEKAFQGILSSAPSVTLLRAEQEDSKLLTPSPFWPGFETQTSVDIWRDPGPAWMRAKWLRNSLEGLNEAEGSERIADFLQTVATGGFRFAPDILPEALSATDMEKALACPYAFFARHILKIEELEKIWQGVSPMDRGNRVHRILASFTRGGRASGPDLFCDRERALQLLHKCVGDELSDTAKEPHWQVERKLLMDSDDSKAPGLLVAWLDEELKRRRDGWECVAEEVDFIDLTDSRWPFSLRGRIDRIDHLKDGGIVCWDYKTGNVPAVTAVVNQFIAPQLPLYLLAVKKGKVPEVQKYQEEGTNLGAGYMQLKSLKAVNISVIDYIEASLESWVDIISRLGEILKMGDFPAIPFPVSSCEKREDACKKCPFINLCEQGLKPLEIINFEFKIKN